MLFLLLETNGEFKTFMFNFFFKNNTPGKLIVDLFGYDEGGAVGGTTNHDFFYSKPKYHLILPCAHIGYTLHGPDAAFHLHQELGK